MVKSLRRSFGFTDQPKSSNLGTFFKRRRRLFRTVLIGEKFIGKHLGFLATLRHLFSGARTPSQSEAKTATRRSSRKHFFIDHSVSVIKTRNQDWNRWYLGPLSTCRRKSFAYFYYRNLKSPFNVQPLPPWVYTDPARSVESKFEPLAQNLASRLMYWPSGYIMKLQETQRHRSSIPVFSLGFYRSGA